MATGGQACRSLHTYTYIFSENEKGGRGKRRDEGRVPLDSEGTGEEENERSNLWFMKEMNETGG